MRNYLFGTGLATSIMGGFTLLRSLREQEPFTWRTGLAWLSWAISLALAIGAIVDTRRARKGYLIDRDSPIHGEEPELLRKKLRKN